MRQVTLNGTPYEVTGEQLQVGAQVPDFEFQIVTPEGPKPKRLSDYAGQTVLFSVTPSIDTGVCATQAKNFDDQAAALPGGIKVVNVSADLPFAQDRFAKESGSSHIEFASDHKDLSFGNASIRPRSSPVSSKSNTSRFATRFSWLPAFGIARRDCVDHFFAPILSVALQTSCPSRFQTCLMFGSPSEMRDQTQTVVPAGKVCASPTTSIWPPGFARAT